MEHELLKLIVHFGWTSWEIHAGADIGDYKLGGDLSVTGLNYDSFVRADPTGYDLHGAGLHQFTNVSSRHTGQYTSPDCMHDSESLSEGMLSEYMHPGEYAIAYIDWLCEGDDCDADDHDKCEPYPEGWLFLAKEFDSYHVRAHWGGELIDESWHSDEFEAYAAMDDLRAKYPELGTCFDVSDYQGITLASHTNV